MMQRIVLNSIQTVRRTKLSSPSISLSTLSSITVSKDAPTHIIFGANTDVGKTIVSTALVKSNLKNSNQQNKVHYIKPLQCGGSDMRFLSKHIPQSGWDGHTLFHWDTPASPHLASRIENKPVSDEQVIFSLQSKLNDIGKEDVISRIWIETAGGVLSPSAASPGNARPKHANDGSASISSPLSWGWSTQADLYKPTHLPAILVGDGRLGGISATLSALESLIMRGYDIHGIVFIDDNKGEHGSNLPALREYATRCLSLRSGSGRTLLKDENSIISLPPLPDKSIPLDDWFESNEVMEQSNRLDEYMCEAWNEHVDILQGLRERGKNSLWWPFTQHQGHDEKKVTATVIDGAAGDYFSILHDKEGGEGLERTAHFDACASWWTQGMGHGEPAMGLSAAAAAGKFGHIIFPDVVHEPATVLAERLLYSKSGPGRDWASRVFFTDDGSTAVEVAIKMGMKKFCHDRKINGEGDVSDKVELMVCAQQDCYHGDTLGVMDVAEPSIFNEGQHPWYEPKGLFLSYPTVRYKNGVIGLNVPTKCPATDSGTFDSVDEIMNVEARLISDLYTHYFQQIQNEWDAYESSKRSRLIGCVVVEPLLLGAGGMKFIDPLWQRALIDIARSKNVPVIFDEVASGLYRVGVASCREILKVDPDVAAYAKLLTGGIVPMSVTLATEDVFKTFLGDSKGEALLHGHSYTAHPIGCVSSIQALDTYAALLEKNGGHNSTKAFFDDKQVSDLSKLPRVKESMGMGTVVAVTIEPDTGGSGYSASGRSIPVVKYLMENGVYARPLGNVVYIMVSPLTSREECKRMCDLLKEAVLSLDE